MARGKLFILTEARLSALYKQESDYEILERFPGASLKGKKYKPLFDYFIKCKENGAFTVLVDHYVKDEEGTGVVHQAPYFGAVSSKLLQKYLWEVNISDHCSWVVESRLSLNFFALPRPMESFCLAPYPQICTHSPHSC